MVLINTDRNTNKVGLLYITDGSVKWYAKTHKIMNASGPQN